MKYTLTILFACLLAGVKAQTPTEQTEPGKFQKPVERLVGHDTTKPTIIVVSETKYLDANSRQGRKYFKKYACNSGLIKPNITCEDCDCRRVVIKKAPTTPVDMMVRHYFGMSYWD